MICGKGVFYQPGEQFEPVFHRDAIALAVVGVEKNSEVGDGMAEWVKFAALAMSRKIDEELEIMEFLIHYRPIFRKWWQFWMPVILRWERRA